ncbi:type III secretion system chaperone [Candidatus Regiella insecticola]|uniref:Tir chaperone n=1 Tax=Candidatus Regiella insecticola TaxID=138073 RepID=A0A6L2ZR70_9ENTR|nr:type III secretion system chaperone [Candidatus Regiella insecticola]GFN47019.1 tir chaperone protein [Candidatus Regiella insecticola]
MNAEQRLGYLAEILDMPSLAFDEKGCCVLTFDDMPITFQALNDRLMMTIYITKLPEDLSANFYLNLLAANFYWEASKGCTLAVDPASRSLVAHIIDNEEERDIKQAIESFLNITEQLHAVMEDPPLPQQRQDVSAMRL